MPKDFELIFNNVLLALQLCLGVWQFTKLTPLGALIQGVVSWLLRRAGYKGYSMLQKLDGRVFKRANCFVLQPEIPSARRGAVELGSQDRLHVRYLGKEFVLDRKGNDLNMLFVDDKMCYYIIPTVWEELHILGNVIQLVGAAIDYVDGAATAAAAAAATASAATASAATASAAAEASAAVVNEAVAMEKSYTIVAHTDSFRAAADRYYATQHAAVKARVRYAATQRAAAVAAADARRAADALRCADSVVLKGHREFWEEVSTGGIMSFDEILDGLILHNQHLSLCLADNRLLPVNLSVSEEKLLKILNLFAIVLQAKKENINWLIPTSVSFISALLEFSTPLRVWLYSNINVLFCSIMHSMCDPLPRPWRRQVYSLGKWVENLKPTNDIPLKIQRGNIRAIIAGVAKIDRQGASLVPWLNVAEEVHTGYVSNRFHCNSIGMDMTCTYFVALNRCQIDAPTVSMFTVECRSMEEYRGIITLVSCMANNGCGSLKSCGPHNKVSVRGFRESVLCYVKSGFPPVYELQLENVVLT